MKFDLIKYDNIYKDYVFPELVPIKYYFKYTTKSFFYKILRFLRIYFNNFYLLNNENNIVIGCILLRKKLNLFKLQQEWFIYGVALKKEFRGEGYGNELLKLTVKECKKLQINEVKLFVGKDNINVISLYQKHGFSTIINRELFPFILNRHKNDLIMSKKIF